MASTGTTTAPLVDFKYKPRGRESVLVSGRLRIHGASTIEAMDLELRTIKNFVGMVAENPKGGGAGGTYWGPVVLHGSVNQPGELANSVYLRPVVGTIYGATFHLGTKTAGTVRVSYIAVGA